MQRSTSLDLSSSPEVQLPNTQLESFGRAGAIRKLTPLILLGRHLGQVRSTGRQVQDVTALLLQVLAVLDELEVSWAAWWESCLQPL